jgi:hypothetical protein
MKFKIKIKRTYDLLGIIPKDLLRVLAEESEL